jgi:hypothetical protein
MDFASLWLLLWWKDLMIDWFQKTCGAAESAGANMRTFRMILLLCELHLGCTVLQAPSDWLISENLWRGIERANQRLDIAVKNLWIVNRLDYGFCFFVTSTVVKGPYDWLISENLWRCRERSGEYELIREWFCFFLTSTSAVLCCKHLQIDWFQKTCGAAESVKTIG